MLHLQYLNKTPMGSTPTPASKLVSVLVQCMLTSQSPLLFTNCHMEYLSKYWMDFDSDCCRMYSNVNLYYHHSLQQKRSSTCMCKHQCKLLSHVYKDTSPYIVLITSLSNISTTNEYLFTRFVALYSACQICVSGT